MNVDNYVQVLNAIKANLDHWKQEEWCGTSYCFAGFAAELNGFDPRKSPLASRVPKEACKFLEISEYSDWDRYLFDGYRTLADFEEVANRLKRGEMSPPA